LQLYSEHVAEGKDAVTVQKLAERFGITEDEMLGNLLNSTQQFLALHPATAMRDRLEDRAARWARLREDLEDEALFPGGSTATAASHYEARLAAALPALYAEPPPRHRA